MQTTELIHLKNQVLQELSHRISLTNLPTDVVCNLLKFLDIRSVLNLLKALPLVYIRGLKTEAAMYCLMEGIREAIGYLKEAVLYSLKIYDLHMDAVVFVNWSPFSKWKGKPVAVLQWANTVPHMQALISEHILSSSVVSNAPTQTHQCRLTVHLRYDVQLTGFCKLSKNTYVPHMPIFTLTVDSRTAYDRLFKRPDRSKYA